MQSKATTVQQYLAELPPDRRAAIQAVRKVVNANLDPVFKETIGYGMIGWVVPLKTYPAGYHCNPKLPLPFANLASQKNHMALYLMCIYGTDGEENWFRKAWAKTGKKLDMGKSCVRFKRVEDLALDVIAEAIRRASAAKYIAHYEQVLDSRPTKPRAKSSTSARKRTTASASKSPTKQGGTKVAKRAAKKAVRKAGAKKAGKRASKKIGKKITKRMAKAAGKKVAKKLGATAGRKVTKRLTKAAGKKVSKRMVKAANTKITKRSTKAGAKKAGKRASKKAGVRRAR